MKYIDEFRDIRLAKNISSAISERAKGLRPINLMEVCGTHTMAICRFGIRKLLPDNINLISGPGCPVCVTPKSYIDKAIALSRLPKTIIGTFGDMMKVPGSNSSLQQEKSSGRDVRIFYSPMDAVDIAEKLKDKSVIFLGIGFETTAPLIAASLKHAKSKRLKNFFVYSGHKLIPPAMKLLSEDPELNIDGFICPAHVSTIIGIKPYEDISRKYNIPCVIAGFEPLDILQGILMLVEQIKTGRREVLNQYRRVVRYRGNTKALNLLDEVFSIKDSEWRGVARIKRSGLALDRRYRSFDAEEEFYLPKVETKPDKGCICGDVLKGIKIPLECRLFGRSCTPNKPIGACMVSSEGTCAAYYRYRIQTSYNKRRPR